MHSSDLNRKLTNLRMKYVSLCLERKFKSAQMREDARDRARGFVTTESLRLSASYGELSRKIRQLRHKIQKLEEIVFVGSLLEEIGLSPDMSSEEIDQHLNNLSP